MHYFRNYIYLLIELFTQVTRCFGGLFDKIVYNQDKKNNLGYVKCLQTIKLGIYAELVDNDLIFLGVIS